MLSNPLAKPTQLDEKSTFERTTEDISEYSKKSEEFNPFSPTKPLTAEEDFALRPKKSGHLNEQSVALKKRYSCDNYSPDRKIEEKIMKVRQKIQIKKSMTLKLAEGCL